MSAEAAPLIREPHRFILKTDDELARDRDEGLLRGSPYWDPVLKGSRSHMRQFLKLLHQAGLLTWRRRVRSQVGCFFVKKKDNMLRLVLDARWTNRMCRPPPHSRLAVPAALSRLLAGAEAAAVDIEELRQFMGPNFEEVPATTSLAYTATALTSRTASINSKASAWRPTSV